ncbi:alpha/beta hydrolase family protein [Vibrio nigripulchritudo]|uniref:alpha/beta hydrolase family protein n=1 Tax=Vibrio nigripulchritudo TaxID=28173 RepID=UPI0003B1ED79|nr:alpha/beta fold hydrolase [Vibrio nigripulchritudo]CCN68753.1 putative alpha/beta-Hydrolase [Vibrio nigripulchritudo SFn118]
MRTGKIILLGLITSLCSTLAVANSALTLPRQDGSEIHYYLNKKQAVPSETLLVLIQGSDCNSVTQIKMIEEDLPAAAPTADILTVEKYGITNKLSYDEDPERKDCPEAFIQNDALSQRVDDYLKILEKIKSQYKYQQVYLIGGSEGALVANLLSAHPDHVSKVVAFNGGGTLFMDDLEHAVKLEVQDKKAYTEIMQEINEFTQFVLNSEPVEFNVSGHGFKWWREMLELNQTEVLRQSQVPVLLIQSEDDTNVSVELAEKQYKTLEKEGKSNIEYLSITGLDHSFGDSDGKSQANKVVESIKEWLIENP